MKRLASKGGLVRVSAIVLISISPTLVGCEQERQLAAGEEIHPQAARFPHAEHPRKMLAESMEGAPEAWVSVTARIGTAQLIQTIDGGRDYLGVVQDVVVDDDGLIFVVDEANARIDVFSPEGARMASYGTHGRGPNEFIRPESIALDGDRGVLVIDRARPSQYFPRIGGTLNDAIGFPSYPISVLYQDSLVIVHADMDSVAIRVSDRAGREISQFGEMYETDNVVVKWKLSEGRLLGHSESSSFVVASRMLPLVHSFGVDGSLRWSSEIPNYRPVPLVGFWSGRYPGSRSSRKGTTHLLASIVRLGTSSLAIIQIAAREANMIKGLLRRNVTMRYFLIDLETGEGAFMGEALLARSSAEMPVLEWATDDRLYVGYFAPEPEVRVLSY
jgi:hypothetical protein